MADNTVIFQGRFTSAGVRSFIDFRSDIDWMRVINLTTTTAVGAGTGTEFYWQKGMTDDTGIEYQKTAVTNALTSLVMTQDGFLLEDTSTNPDKAINATVTSITGAAIPICTCTSTAGLVAGDIVRFVNVGGVQQFGGVDFTIDTVVANTSFRLPYAPQIVAGALPGSFYPVKWDPIYYPRRRFMTVVARGATTTVIMSVTHGLTIGQKVRFQVPAEYGMTQLDGLTGTITATNAVLNSITVDIDSTNFTPFAFPLTGAVPFTHAQVIPVGEDGTSAAGITLDDATTNTAVIRMSLGAGVQAPAGVLNDVIYWIAGKSFSVDNQ